MNPDPTFSREAKLLAPSDAARIAAELRAAGRRLVTTNGTFDLLHVGHLDQLEEARRQGDVLFVGINADAAVREAKGPGRPLFPVEARGALLAALSCVDFVVVLAGRYAEEPMQSLLPVVRPHVHVNGPDYGPPETWREWPAMQALGIAAHAVARRHAVSTSDVIFRIRNAGPH